MKSKRSLSRRCIARFDDDQEPTDLTIAEVLTDFVPLSKTMAEQITGLTELGQRTGAVCHVAAD